MCNRLSHPDGPVLGESSAARTPAPALRELGACGRKTVSKELHQQDCSRCAPRVREERSRAAGHGVLGVHRALRVP